MQLGYCSYTVTTTGGDVKASDTLLASYHANCTPYSPPTFCALMIDQSADTF